MPRYKRPTIADINLVRDDIFYRVGDLQAMLKNLELNSSIYSILDAESWKCLNSKCGKRYREETATCLNCGGDIRKPIITSPRLRTNKGLGARIYFGVEIKNIVEIFKQLGHHRIGSKYLL